MDTRDREFEFISQKIQAMLAVITTDLVAELMGRFGLSEDEISRQVKLIEEGALESIIEDQALYHRLTMVLVYLALLKRQLGLDVKTYDC
jgi:hypothetical protein